MAEAQGWHAQSTSVPGVAQRTGATLYYVEMMPKEAGREPVLSLMPATGGVDIVIAAEWMEAGRAMLRGLLSPERTTLIASTHRALAVAEKEPPAASIGRSAAVTDAARLAAKRSIAFNMAELAAHHGSPISAALFGALAGSGLLPFPLKAFEDTIALRHVASLAAFHAARNEATRTHPAEAVAPSQPTPTIPEPFLEHIASFPEEARPVLAAGVARLIAFQDEAYASDYLSHVAAFDMPATIAAARSIALAMAYDDVISVAAKKVSPERFERIAREMGADDTRIVTVTEYVQPGAAEIVGLLPARLGSKIEASPTLMRIIGRLAGGPKRVRTDHIFPFLTLKTIAGLKRFRRGNLRHQREMTSMYIWLDAAKNAAQTSPRLAVSILSARKLQRGYSGTYRRGVSAFERIMASLPRLQNRPDAAEWLNRLIAAAEKDDSGVALEGALETIAELD
jgi:indolepyruvate ferredoxin oxidoreductase beta subunit